MNKHQIENIIDDCMEQDYEVQSLRERLYSAGYMMSTLSIKRAYYDGLLDESEYWQVFADICDSHGLHVH